MATQVILVHPFLVRVQVPQPTESHCKRSGFFRIHPDQSSTCMSVASKPRAQSSQPSTDAYDAVSVGRSRVITFCRRWGWCERRQKQMHATRCRQHVCDWRPPSQTVYADEGVCTGSLTGRVYFLCRARRRRPSNPGLRSRSIDSPIWSVSLEMANVYVLCELGLPTRSPNSSNCVRG